MNRAHPWMPVSPCGDGCLPPAGVVSTVGRVRRLLRLLGVAVMLLAGAALATALPRLGPARREWALRAWFRALLGTLRIQLVVTGGDRFGPPGAGILVVSNHVSWLDLVVLGAVQPLRMVAKNEVRTWPVIGPLARRAGTVFVDRERLSTLPRAVTAVSGALAGGAAIGAFPEGTTWCGLTSGRFRPACVGGRRAGRRHRGDPAAGSCRTGLGATCAARGVAARTCAISGAVTLVPR